MLDLGAQHVIDHKEPLAPQVKALGTGPVRYVFSTHTDARAWAEIAKLIAPQGRFGLIDDPEPLDLRLVKFKSVSIHWEAMFTRPMFQTADMVRQHEILGRGRGLARCRHLARHRRAGFRPDERRQPAPRPRRGGGREHGRQDRARRVLTLLDDRATQAASDLLFNHWRGGTVLDALPDALRPATREEGYAVQARLEARSPHPLFGWKIAATSTAGQQHINVDGPLAGRLLAEMVSESGAVLPFGANRMRVAEAEFAFRMGRDLLRAPRLYVDEVMAAVATLHPAIEVPDSRFATSPASARRSSSPTTPARTSSCSARRRRRRRGIASPRTPCAEA